MYGVLTQSHSTCCLIRLPLRSPRTDSSSVSSLTDESDVEGLPGPVGHSEKAEDDGGDDAKDGEENDVVDDVEHRPNGDDSCSEHAADQEDTRKDEH